MNTRLLSFVYSALFVTGLAVGVPLILSGSPWQGATAVILGLIGLQDAVAWSSARSVKIGNTGLRGVDFVGVLFGAVAVIAPSVAAADPTRAFWSVLVGSTGYMGACLMFWLLFERLDSTAFHGVLTAWSKRRADARKFVYGFAVALVVLTGFIVMLQLDHLAPTEDRAWMALDLALVLYLVLYRVLGAKGRAASIA